MDSTGAVPQPTLGPGLVGTELLLIRHGRSADVMVGSAEAFDPPLHPLGVEQAAAVASRLATKRIDAVYASHLARAIQTAEAIASSHGLVVETIEDLQEVQLGDWGGGEFRRRAAAADPEWTTWNRTGSWDGVPGGEGDVRFRGRVTGAIEQVAHRHPAGIVAVVVHGGVVNAYLASVLGMARSVWLTVENTSITVVRIADHSHHVVVANDCNHLYDPVLAGPAG